MHFNIIYLGEGEEGSCGGSVNSYFSSLLAVKKNIYKLLVFFCSLIKIKLYSNQALKSVPPKDCHAFQ